LSSTAAGGGGGLRALARKTEGETADAISKTEEKHFLSGLKLQFGTSFKVIPD
jgi:hypothetical protein